MPFAGLGDMAQATTIYDASDHPAFTIYKEQRLEVPLDKVSPNLIKAVTRSRISDSTSTAASM